MIGDLDEVQWAYLLDPTFELVNTAGKPLTDGWIEVYIHGTRNKYYCAKDFDGTLHEFKIPLDSLGANIVLASPAHAYDVYVYNKFGSLIMSRYNVVPATGDGVVYVAKDVLVLGTDGTVLVDTENLPNSVKYDLSIKDTVDRVQQNEQEIGQIKDDVANTKTDLTNLTEVVNNHTTEIGQIKEDVNSLEADPIWEDITNKIGNYDNTQTKDIGRRLKVLYSRKLALITLGGFIAPTASGNGVRIFSFNTDIVNFNNGEYFAKNGSDLIYVSLSPYNVNTEYRKSYSITARVLTTYENVEFGGIMIPLGINTKEFNAYIDSH